MPISEPNLAPFIFGDLQQNSPSRKRKRRGSLLTGNENTILSPQGSGGGGQDAFGSMF